MVERKLLFGTTCISVGIFTMSLYTLLAQTFRELKVGLMSGAVLIVIGVAFSGLWIVDRIRKKGFYIR